MSSGCSSSSPPLALKTRGKLEPPRELTKPLSLGAAARVVESTALCFCDDDDASFVVVGYSDGTVALFARDEEECEWFARRRKKVNAFDSFREVEEGGGEDDDVDEDDDEEDDDDDDEEEKMKLGVDCVRATKNFVVRASGSGYQRAAIDVLDARSGKHLTSLRLPTFWPPECASFEVQCEEFEAGQIIVAATSCRTTKRSYENVVGCESAFAAWVPFRKKNGCDPVVSWRLGPHITLANERERVVEGFLCPTIRVKEKSLSSYDEETRYFDIFFERVTELNGEVRATSGRTTISYDPVTKETEVFAPVTFDEDAASKSWGKTSSKVSKARKMERDKAMSDKTYQREFGTIKAFRGKGVLLIYFPSGEAVVRAFGDPATRRTKTVLKANLSILEQSLRTAIVGNSQGRELDSIHITDDNDEANVFSAFILSREVEGTKSNPTPRAVLQRLRVPLVPQEETIVTPSTSKNEFGAGRAASAFPSTKSLLDDLPGDDIKDSAANDFGNENRINKEERACALCLENEVELGKPNLLNDMPCCSSTMCKRCLLAYVRRYPGSGCPSCRNVPIFHAFAGSDADASPSRQHKVVVETQSIDIESFNAREGLASALARASLESTGSELEDLELYESSRGKREKIAFSGNARIVGEPRMVVTLGANGFAYANVLVSNQRM
jgi:hypothetical protein